MGVRGHVAQPRHICKPLSEEPTRSIRVYACPGCYDKVSIGPQLCLRAISQRLWFPGGADSLYQMIVRWCHWCWPVKSR